MSKPPAKKPAAKARKAKKRASKTDAGPTYVVPVAGIISAVLTLREMDKMETFRQASEGLEVEVPGALLKLFADQTGGLAATSGTSSGASAGRSAAPPAKSARTAGPDTSARAKAETFAAHVARVASGHEPDDTGSCRKKGD